MHQKGTIIPDLCALKNIDSKRKAEMTLDWVKNTQCKTVTHLFRKIINQIKSTKAIEKRLTNVFFENISVNFLQATCSLYYTCFLSLSPSPPYT